MVEMSGVLIARVEEFEAVMASAGDLQLEIPTFRIKRSHKKSRLGCINCKRRRVKVSKYLKKGIDEFRQRTYLIEQCDEKPGRCDRCRFRGLDCVYAERPNQTTAPGAEPSSSTSVSTSASPGSHTSTEQLWSPSQETWSVLGVTDTELARHYLANTVDKFAATSTRPEQTNMWRAVLPSLAFNSQAVRRGMLTLAAMVCSHCIQSMIEVC